MAVDLELTLDKEFVSERFSKRAIDCDPAVAMILFVLFAISAHAEKGQSSYKQGRQLEPHQNYEAAYEAYQRAYNAVPLDTRYRASLTRIRFLAAASKVHRATLLQQAGKFEEALILFEQAVRIDPSSPIASQQVINTRNMIQQARANPIDRVSHSASGISPEELATPWYSDPTLPFDTTLADVNEYGAMYAARRLSNLPERPGCNGLFIPMQGVEEKSCEGKTR